MKTIKRCKTCHSKFVPALKEAGKIQEYPDQKHCFYCDKPSNPYSLLVSEEEYKKFLQADTRQTTTPPLRLKYGIPLPKKYTAPNLEKNELENQNIKPAKTHKSCPKCKTNLPLTVEFFSFSKNHNKPSTYCKKCNKESVKAAKLQKRDFKQKALEYKGGKCSLCGYNKCPTALEFHHVNPKEKEISVSQYSKFDEKLRLELDKCELLCSNCHREVHYYMKNPPPTL